MAIVISNLNYYEEKSKRLSIHQIDKKPWMLRDYLRDDMSSCSSNGFRSLPRKQCCVAVKNIIEKEVIWKQKTPKKRLRRNKSSVSSALQRASLVIINAVKLLPFTSAAASSSTSSTGSGLRLLPRSFSKKLFKKSFFWNKRSSPGACVADKTGVIEECDDDEIERWISSGVVATETYQPSDLSNDTTVTNVSSTSNSHYTSDESKSSSSWSDITFTSDFLTGSNENETVKKGGKSEGKNDGGEGEDEEVVSGVVGSDSGQESAIISKNTWCNEEAETEQLSPISVMDFPYNDEGSASPFTLRVSRLKGTKERLMEKLGRFESLAGGLGLDCVNLETLMSTAGMDDHSPKRVTESCSTPSLELSSESETSESEEVEEDGDEKRVQYLLNKIKHTNPIYKTESDNLLLNYFRENVAQKTDESLLQTVEDWVNGHYDTLILGWEVKNKRQAYIRDMEERGRWPKDCKLEKEEVAIELGDEVLATLIQEVIVQFC